MNTVNFVQVVEIKNGNNGNKIKEPLLLDKPLLLKQLNEWQKKIKMNSKILSISR